MKLDKLDYNIHSEFHMLRHFECVNEDKIHLFEKAGYSCAEITHEMQEPGSRFFSDFANDIDSLLKKIFGLVFNKTIAFNGKINLLATADKNKYPLGIGTTAILSLKEIPENLKDEIYYEMNRGQKLLHLKVNEFPTTNNYTIIIDEQHGQYNFISAFPGEPAMPLADDKMNEKLYQKAKQYWEEHVFLVKICK